jgi:hypothetical protein
MSLEVKNELSEGTAAPASPENSATEDTAPAPAAPETKEAAPEEGGDAPDAPAGAKDDPAQATPPYTPNYKLKVMDREVEIDEMLRPLIKDQASEKKIRELVEKAYGLDFAKPKHEALQTQFNEFQQGFQQLGEMAQGRLQEFLDFWKIPKEKLYEHVASLLNYEQLAPEEKARVDRERQLEAQARQGQLQHQQLLQRYQDEMAAVRVRELDTAISRSDISQVATEFDTRVGRPGAFRGEVVRRARMIAYETGKDISVDDAIKEVMSSLGYVEAPAGGAGTPASQAPTKVVAAVAQKKHPVLPNVGGGGASPVKKVVNSLGDLRRIRKEMTAAR